METKTDEEIIMPQYDYLECKTRPELIKQMNEKAAQGYIPVWPSHKPMLMATDDYFVILEYHEPIDTEERIEIKAELSQLILEAEFQVAKANGNLEDAKKDLNFKTDWKQASEDEGYVNPIKTVGDKASYINDKTKDKDEWLEQCKGWLAHIKRLEKARILPDTLSPWEQKIQDLKVKDVKYPDNSIELGGIMYCQDMKNSCSKCLKCETKESE